MISLEYFNEFSALQLLAYTTLKDHYQICSEAFVE